MLSMPQINQMLRQNFQVQLQQLSTVPDDLARGYKDWVHGLIAQVSQKMQMENNPQAAMGADVGNTESATEQG